MAPPSPSKKRKAVTRDVEQEPELSSGDEFQEGLLDGILSQDDTSASEDDKSELDEEDDHSDEDEEDEDEELDSDEIPSEDDEADIREQIRNLKTQDEASRTKINGTARQANGTKEDAEEDDDDAMPGPQGMTSNYSVTTDANGNPRYIYQDIDPVYDSDDSDAPEIANTIGNIPLSFYDSYPHIGYDVNGKKIMRPAKGEALDSLLNSIEIPKGWTGMTDPATGQPLNLSDEELQILKQITRNEVPADGYDPYPEMVEWFTNKQEIMPLSAAPEPKRRFVPSKHESKRVMKMVKAIREGRIKPYRPPEEEEAEQEDPTIQRYDIWADEAPRPDHPMNIPAPKLPPPGYEESYHPPPEYLPDKDEKAAWEAADEEEREREFLPTDHTALRRVPGYDSFVKERFERCLDLYLAPRVRRNKLNIDPESLLPKLPNPDELRPFPTTCATLYRGHEGRVRSVAIDPSGVYLASGGDDGTVRVWELLTGRQLYKVKLSDEEAVNTVSWRPHTDTMIIAACSGETVSFLIPLPLCTPDVEQASRDVLLAGVNTTPSAPPSITKEPPAKWNRPSSSLQDEGVLLTTTLRNTVKVLSWHRRGDYFVTVSPRGASHAVAIHTLSTWKTQLPFRRLKGQAQSAAFHPSQPLLFVATQRQIRAYDLARQELTRALQPGARWISSFDVHPSGTHVLVGSYDRRLLWHDTELSPRPYRTLRYHAKAIRAVAFHRGPLPLFADASDDGSLQVFHGRVVDDLMENAAIVPLKVLRGHRVTSDLGVLALDWHPKLPWLVSAGADGTCMLWN